MKKAKVIIRQVEFYFSDSNLPRDKFLRTTMEQSEDGLVSLALICSFSRMRGHLGLGEVKPEELSPNFSINPTFVFFPSITMTVSIDEEKAKVIIRQVEFYFSDSNLPRDKFLRTTMEQSEDGLVSLALICSFSRMRGHLGLGEVKPEEVLEETVLAVAEVLRKSSSLKVSEDGRRIGRSTELLKPEKLIEQVDSRTVAASPLPYDVVLEDVQAFFGQKGKVNSVRLPRHVGDKRVFCGVGLIEFAEEEDARSVLTEKLVYNGVDLEIKPKKDFDAEREKSIEVEKNRSNKDGSNESYPKGLIISFKLKTLAADASTTQKEEVNDVTEVKGVEVPKPSDEEHASENVGNQDNSSDEAQKGEGNDQSHACEDEENVAIDSSEGKEDKSTKDSMTCSVSKVVSVADVEDVVTREDLRHVLQKFGTIKFIDYKMGEESGYVRFENPDAGLKARAAAVLRDEGGLVVKKKYVATLEAVTGDAEKNYWSLLRGNQEKHKENWGRGKQNRGGRQFVGKRRHEFSSSKGRPNKAQKFTATND
ncbi:hypothetical protein HPP92_013605 [Vanilla planifolia]|uniref:La protein 1 n=1 Tax=Vanilla planifolia TaxID=51239 RepID=A0A835QQD0_VANPL|nr:hypothetical protein HPP92_013605 [Vanilla planifolia]